MIKGLGDWRVRCSLTSSTLNEHSFQPIERAHVNGSKLPTIPVFKLQATDIDIFNCPSLNIQRGIQAFFRAYVTHVDSHNIEILVYAIEVDQQARATVAAEPVILLLRVELVFLHVVH